VSKEFGFLALSSPAGVWRAFLCALVLAFVSVSGGLARTDDAADAERRERDGAEILRTLREAGLEGDYHLRFELRVLPRRGRAQVFSGELWGSHNGAGPVSRVVLYEGEGAGADRVNARPLRTLLIQNGAEPQIWVYEAGMAVVERLPQRDWHAPLLAGAEISAFDLLMPYLYWEDCDLEGSDKILGRVADRFLFREPRREASNGPGDSEGRISVRAYFDQQFHAFLQSKLIGPDGAVAKTLTVRDLQKVSGQWMLKSIDLRNERTRDKTRFEVKQAELGLDLDPRIFETEFFGEAFDLPNSPDRVSP